MLWNRKPTNSKLFNEKTFYAQFLKDMESCQKEIIIESPYITASRMEILTPVFQRLLNERRKIIIITRDPSEHEEYLKHQSTNEILACEDLGVEIFLEKGFHHRKLAILDRKILWEGSLNILSYSHSKEIMRRIDNEVEAKQMLSFLKRF